jgi:hypothetical protein
MRFDDSGKRLHCAACIANVERYGSDGQFMRGEPRSRLLGRHPVNVSYHHSTAFMRERGGDRRAETAGAAGDNRDLVHKLEIHI